MSVFTRRNGDPARITKDRIDQYRKERGELEIDLLDEVLTSRRRGWQVAVGSWGLTMTAFVLTGFVIHRYSQPVLQQILVLDRASGTVQQLSVVADMPSYGEITDTFWVEQFVNHFETYDFNSAQVDYDTIALMADSAVAEQYQAKWGWGTTKAVDKIAGDNETTQARIISTVLDPKTGTATVRFTTTKKYRQRPVPESPQYWIAIVSYRYEPSLMTAAQRRLNPLGLRISSYRVTAESSNRVGG